MNTKYKPHMAGLARAFSDEIYAASIKQRPEDFIVNEQISFDLAGEGEHVYLQIQKTSLNTEDVALSIAKFAEVKRHEVSYAGLKDRNALTTQWFSVHLPGKINPDWTKLETDNLSVLQQQRHNRKLRRGSIKSNHFIITLRDVQDEKSNIEQRLQVIQIQGVPNYFAEQRFGRNENNIAKAYDMFNGSFKVKSRHQRSLYLSAARSLLFNQVLSHRVTEGNWNHAIHGDAMMLAGSHSFFVVHELDSEIQTRVSEFDVHPTGPLWGEGKSPVQYDAKMLEEKVLDNEPVLLQGLKQAGMKQQRRALRLLAEQLEWQWLAEDVLQISFSLASGCYATAVLRECFAL